MVDIRCHKRTVEIAISPNIPPTLMRLMLLSHFERKLEAFKKSNAAKLKKEKAEAAAAAASASGGEPAPPLTPSTPRKNSASLHQARSASPGTEDEVEDDGDMVSRMPNLEDYGEVCMSVCLC